MGCHVVDGEVDGEEVIDEVAGGVDVEVAGDEDADGAPAKMEELVLADRKLLRSCGREAEGPSTAS